MDQVSHSRGECSVLDTLPNPERIPNHASKLITNSHAELANRLKTTCMGLGLVRLLQDAKRFEEARTTLYPLESDFRSVDVGKSNLKPCKANRLKGDSSRFSFVSMGTSQKFAHSIN